MFSPYYCRQDAEQNSGRNRLHRRHLHPAGCLDGSGGLRDGLRRECELAHTALKRPTKRNAIIHLSWGTVDERTIKSSYASFAARVPAIVGGLR
jgi:hypothetical protein